MASIASSIDMSSVTSAESFSALVGVSAFPAARPRDALARLGAQSHAKAPRVRRRACLSARNVLKSWQSPGVNGGSNTGGFDDPQDFRTLFGGDRFWEVLENERNRIKPRVLSHDDHASLSPPF